MSRKKIVQIHDKSFEPFISKKDLKKIVKKLAKQVNGDYAGKDVIVIGVLDGVILFMSDFIRKLDFNLSVELIKLKSYQGTKSTGKIEELLGVGCDVKDKHVLVVEDIVDTGNTMTHLMKDLQARRPKSLEMVTLLLKEEVFGDKFPIKYVGKKIEDRFVVGYGMDYDGAGRQLPEIFVSCE